MDVTPERILELSKANEHSKALNYAFRLNEEKYLMRVVENIKIDEGLFIDRNNLIFNCLYSYSFLVKFKLRSKLSLVSIFMKNVNNDDDVLLAIKIKVLKEYKELYLLF